MKTSFAFPLRLCGFLETRTVSSLFPVRAKRSSRLLCGFLETCRTRVAGDGIKPPGVSRGKARKPARARVASDGSAKLDSLIPHLSLADASFLWLRPFPPAHAGGFMLSLATRATEGTPE